VKWLESKAKPTQKWLASWSLVFSSSIHMLCTSVAGLSKTEFTISTQAWCIT